MLVWRFVEDFSKAFGKQIESISKDNIATLQRYAWPGNVRELRNVVERALIVADSPRLTIALPQGSAAATRRSVRLADVEKEHIKGVLDSTGVADSRRRRRRRTARAQSHDARDAHGETGAPAAAPLTPAFRARSAIRGTARPAGGGHHFVDRRQLEAAQKHRAAVPRASAWYVWCSCPARGAPRRFAGGPARGTKQLVDALRFLASPIRLEPGCLGCRVWIDDSDESIVRYVEEWATEEAMRLRVRSERFTRLLEVFESAQETPSVQFDFVTETRGLDYVAEVRNSDGMLKAPPGV